MLRRFISLIICVAFLCTGTVPPAIGQELFLPSVNSAVSLSAPSMPLLLRGMKVDAKDPLHMDFLVDQGRGPASDESFKDESLRLIKYFLASLTIPEKDLWVNLSPYENQRIIQDDFGRTGMGRDLLAQDYILKQLTAGLLHPDGVTGKVFWAEIYKRAYDQYGTTDIPVDTFNKVWIMPAKSVVYESRSPDGKKISAFIQEMKLKVMLETDYLATSNNPLPTGGHAAPFDSVSSGTLPSDSGLNAKAAEGTNSTTSELTKDILREVVIPVLEKEVNEGANFALLRQVSYSLILSVWLKKKLMTSAQEAAQSGPSTGNILSRIFINRHKTEGIEIVDPKAQTQMIYDRYVEAFKRGAYDLIKEEVDTYSQELIPRKYFSGGWSAKEADNAMVIYDAAQLPGIDASGFNEVNVDLSQITDNGKRTGPNTMEWTVKKQTPQKMKLSPRKLMIAGLIVASLAGGIWLTSRVLPHAQKARMEISVQQNITSDDVISTLKIMGRNYKFFEDALSSKNTPSYSAKDLLASMTGGRHSERLAKEVAATFQDDFDTFCPGIKASGVSVEDVFQEMFAVMLTESGAQEKSIQNQADDLAPGFGSSQFESKTLRYLFQTDIFRKNKDKILNAKEYQGILNSMKGTNRWYVSKVKQSALARWDVQMAFLLISWEDMFTKDFTPEEQGFFIQSGDAFANNMKMINADIRKQIQDRMDEKNLTMRESYQELVKEHKELPPVQVFQLMVAVSHKAGGPRTYAEYEAMINYFEQEKDARLDSYAKASVALDAAISRRDASWTELEGFLLGSKYARPLFSKDLKKAKEQIAGLKSVNVGHGDLFRRALKALSKDPKGMSAKKFMSLYGRFGLRFGDLRMRQRESNSLAPYVDINYSLIHGENAGDFKIGKDLRDYYRAKDNSQINNSQVNGGIDLSAQESAMDILGRSGTFNLDLSPEQMKILDQDVRGFLPIIINIQPVKDVKMFLGFQSAEGVPVGS